MKEKLKLKNIYFHVEVNCNLILIKSITLLENIISVLFLLLSTVIS